jgi:large subunit ribosomal protein L35
MPKLKTHSGAKDRFRLTKNGKLLRRRSSGSHFLQKKSAARKRRINTVATLAGKSVKNIKLKLGA